VVVEEVERLVELIVLLPTPLSWKGRARADPANAAVKRANEKCMLLNVRSSSSSFETTETKKLVKRVRVQVKSEC